jgi:hypothetical protein
VRECSQGCRPTRRWPGELSMHSFSLNDHHMLTVGHTKPQSCSHTECRHRALCVLVACSGRAPVGPPRALVGHVDPAAQLLCHQASATVGPGQVGRVCSTTGPPGQFQPTREGWSFNPFSFFRIDSNFRNLYLFEY